MTSSRAKEFPIVRCSFTLHLFAHAEDQEGLQIGRADPGREDPAQTEHLAAAAALPGLAVKFLDGLVHGE